jgi:hypothetical protein
MRLSCFWVRRHLMVYVDHELDASCVKRVEDHLSDCGLCRTRLVQLRAGRRFALQLPDFESGNEGWHALETALDKLDTEGAGNRSDPRPQRSWGVPRVLARPALAATAVSVTFLIIGLFAIYVRLFPATHSKPTHSSGWAVDTRDFHAVTIDDIGRSTDPHVVAEGFVSDVHVDEDEGDLTFRLVDDMRNAQPFIVCEIISPINLAAPAVGSYVRVYGVSRYDSKADHQWYEVHPVLDIQAVKR